MVVYVNRWEAGISLLRFKLLTLTAIPKHRVRWDVEGGPILDLTVD